MAVVLIYCHVLVTGRMQEEQGVHFSPPLPPPNSPAAPLQPSTSPPAVTRPWLEHVSLLTSVLNVSQRSHQLACCVHVLTLLFSPQLPPPPGLSSTSPPPPASHPLLLSHARPICFSSSLSLQLIPRTIFSLLPLIIHSHLHLLDTPSPSSWFRLVSQDALFGAASLGPSSMGGDWVGRRSTDWTLSLRTGALAGHPPSTSDGRGR